MILLEHLRNHTVQEIVHIPQRYPSISIQINEPLCYDLVSSSDLFVHKEYSQKDMKRESLDSQPAFQKKNFR